MKNIFCLFERPFKIQKNGVLVFEISFVVLEILKFFYGCVPLGGSGSGFLIQDRSDHGVPKERNFGS